MTLRLASAARAVVASLSNGPGGRSIGLRADMDALPINEATGLGQCQRRGRRDACPAAMMDTPTILLAAAKELAGGAISPATLRLIFQPAEEIGGAVQMIEGRAVRALPGRCGVRAAQVARGAGGRVPLSSPGRRWRRSTGSSSPSRGRAGMARGRTTRSIRWSPLRRWLLALQTIVSRNVDPLQMAVLTIGSIHGGVAPNVIPDSVELQITTRAFTPEVQQLMRERIRGAGRGTCGKLRSDGRDRPSAGLSGAAQSSPRDPSSRGRPPSGISAPTRSARCSSRRWSARISPSCCSSGRAAICSSATGRALTSTARATISTNSIIEPASRYWVALVEDYLAANAGPEV